MVRCKIGMRVSGSVVPNGLMIDGKYGNLKICECESAIGDPISISIGRKRATAEKVGL
jgi:hypothetical protein